MGDRWGPDGPPEEAYSRVTRDLRTVFADLVARLDTLPGELVERHDAVVRPATDAEVARLAGTRPHYRVTDVVAIVPRTPGASPLMLGRVADPEDGGTSAVVAFGDHLVSIFPVCWCDACDTDSDEAIDELEEYVEVVTGGFTEQRRTEQREEGAGSAGLPMLGFTATRAAQAHSSPGPEFETRWAPWRARGGSPAAWAAE